MHDFTLRIAGESGEGVITIGETVARIAAREGLHLVTFRTFPAEIKGGPCMMQLRLSDEQISYHGEKVDCLVALNQYALEENLPDLKPDGVLLCEAECDVAGDRSAGAVHKVPFERIAVREIGSRISKNIVVLGVLSHLLGIPRKSVEDFLAEKFAKKSKAILEHNLRALESGIGFAEAHVEKRSGFGFPAGDKERRLLMTGNEAIALGAATAGLKCFFGYPITPASEIMEWLAVHLPKLGGKVLQTEDEISAISAVAGASWAGEKAMTATSGPGVSLMSEALGLLSIAEIPAVIVDSQRGGPSTGLPTKTEQSDLLLAVYGSHGDAPRVVIAPTSVPDCLRMIGVAFYLAEKYQTPVIVLVDQALSARVETVNPRLVKNIPLAGRLSGGGEHDGPFARYRLADNPVSPAATPGTEGCEHMVTGMEHDEFGNFACDEETHTAMTVKRFRKLAAIENDPAMDDACLYFGEGPADVGVVTWGSSSGPVEEAIREARRLGISARAIAPKILNPLPHEKLKKFFTEVKCVVVPELNFVGQLATLLRSTYRVPTLGLTKIKGVPLEPGEIVEKIIEAANGLHARSEQRNGTAG
jgi:2-oxoglutarate/2-oxoacid ferredoxin oxidoreductase subunit alpha